MRFLCLHGFGTNSNILELQTAGLRYQLTRDHTFDFAEGSETCPREIIPPSVLEHFPHEEGYYAYFDPTSATSILAAVVDLENYLESEQPIDAVFAFSHGASLAGTLMHKVWIEQQQHAHSIEPALGAASSANSVAAVRTLRSPFSAAVFLSAATPYSYTHLQQGIVQELTSSGDGVLFDIPSIHIWGEHDVDFPGMSARCVGLCNPNARIEVVHGGGHEVPLGPKRTIQEVVEGIEETVRRAELMQ